MGKDEIRKLMLEHGFKLKEQPDGRMDLNDYVYDAACALIAYAQRDPMAVAKAVHRAACEEAGKSYGAERMRQIDLSAIVEAVQPATKHEPATKQLLAALKHMVNVCDSLDFDGAPSIAAMNEARSAIAATEDAFLTGWCESCKVETGTVRHCDVCGEPTETVSDQQQGEPVAWAAFASNGNCRIWFGDKASADNWAEATGVHGPLSPLYTAPPVLACSVPEGWKLVPEWPSYEMLVAAAAREQVGSLDYGRLSDTYRSMLAAAPKPEGGA